MIGFWDFIFTKLDFTQLILDVFTLGIYGAIKTQKKIIEQLERIV